MKLFHWPSVTALQRHSSGEAFALATSREEAAALIVANLAAEYPPFDPDDPDDYNAQRIADLKEELESTAPEEHDAPCGFALFGSE